MLLTLARRTQADGGPMVENSSRVARRVRYLVPDIQFQLLPVLLRSVIRRRLIQ